MRVLLATTRGAGHLGPLIPLARACLRAGHEVLVAGPGAARPLAERAGLPFEAVGEPPPETVAAAWAPVWGPPEAAPGAVHVVQELFVALSAGAALPGMLALVERRRPDVVVRETLEFSSSLAAERAGVPQVRFGIHLSSTTDGNMFLPIVAPALDALRPAAGLPPDPTAAVLAGSPLLTMAPAALDDPAAPPHAVAPRRFRETEAPRDVPLPAGLEDDGRPLVYLSFGSEAGASALYPGIYREAVAALAELPARVLVTIGGAADPAALGAPPPSVAVVPWFPMAAAMARSAAVVGHGGSGTTLTAVAAGVPQAFAPLFVDGPANARLVAGLGAGIALERPLDLAGDLGGAVRELLHDPRHRRGAEALAARMRELPPIDEAVGDLEAVAAG